MTRDETLELFKKCEAARAEAAAKGANVDEAHEAAKAIWNGWAETQIAKRRELEMQGKWALLKRKGETRFRWFQRHSSLMQNWLLQARADFSRCRIILNPSSDIVPDIKVTGLWIDFREFLFPGEADFTEAELSGITFFDRSIFRGPTWFRGSETKTINSIL